MFSCCAGCEIAPRAMSTRIVSTIWWFFTLIMISSYTANLAAFLTIQISSDNINSVEDLVNTVPQVKYGSVADSQIETYFDTSTRHPYR